MNRYKIKLILVMLAAALSIALAYGDTTLKWKALLFDNPGSKRLLKTEQGSYFYYRSLPEKDMLLGVKDISTIEIRAFSKAKVDKPQFILHNNGKKAVYELKFKENRMMGSNKYYVYEPVRIVLPPNLKQLELTCYDRDVYFRAFRAITVMPKPKLPALSVLGSSGTYNLANDSSKKTYYDFKDKENFTFQVNKNRSFALYVRAELTSREVPVFAIYKDGIQVQKVQLSIKRSKAYTAEGILNLTVGKRIDFPSTDKLAKYELRPVTNHLFIARPVILKSGR